MAFNVELKASDPDPAATLRRALALGAADHGVIVQRDTFFAVDSGRLKLREESPGEPHLIQYERADDAAVKRSNYRIVPAAPGLRQALAAALGVTVVVEKRRRLLLLGNVRIHLDEVERLGSFVELEAVAGPERSAAAEHERVEELRAALGISDRRLAARAYADMLG